MKLLLKKLPQLLGPNDKVYHGKVPTRALYLYPDAANSLLELEKEWNGLIYTDIFRSAKSSLDAHKSKSGVQPPGYSAHGYGLAVDVDITATLKKLHINYPELRDLMGKYDWYCHRLDLESEQSEAWHFNYLGKNARNYLNFAERYIHASWSLPVEGKIKDIYGDQFKLSHEEVTKAVDKLGFKNILQFQKSWDLATDGMAGPKTQRLLAYLTADTEYVES